jgi:hypothetical protein
MRLRIGAKSVGLFCIVGLLPVTILSIGSFWSARDAMQRVVADNLALSARATVDNLERFFESRRRRPTSRPGASCASCRTR